MRALFLCGLLLGLAATSPSIVSAVPSAERHETIKNADGTSFVGVTRGDEHRNWVETADGFTVAKQSDGNWYYVARWDDGTPVVGTVRASAPPPAGLSKHMMPALEPGARARALPIVPAAAPFGPFTGPVLFLLAQFSDQAPVTTAGSWSTFITANIADFYSKVSYGAVSLVPAVESHGTSNDGVVGWLNLGYPHPNPGDQFDDRVQQIARDAMIASDPYVNYAAYDTNADGVIEPDELGVVVIVAGYERSYSGNYAPSVWGHRWGIYCCGGAPVLDGKTIYDYAEFGERHRGSPSDDHQATMGIMVHELGHLIFGLPDLYDTDYSTSGIGAFSVMSGGSWGTASGDPWIGMTPVAADAWVKHDRGWVATTDGAGVVGVVGGGTAGANAYNTVFRVPTGIPTEYFLVENRQDAGYDRGLEGLIGPVGGVAIWHVDETIYGNADETHRKVDLEEADGTESYGSPTDLWYVGNATAFNDASTPNSKRYDGANIGRAVDVLTGSASSMNVRFSTPSCGNGVAEGTEQCDGADADACPTNTCQVDCTCPPPVCGNGVLEPGEVCDAPDDGPCPAGTCAGDCDCTPAVCGDDVIELGEQCDGTEDSACPGECGAPADPDACLCPNADSCATPRDVVVFPYADTQDTSGATVAPSDPLLTCGSTSIQQAHSVWYRVVAPANGTIAADTFGSSYDTVLAAHTGTCGSLVPVPGACNDDSAGYQSEIGFPVTGGSAYLLEVTSYSTTSGGTLQLHVDFVGAATPTPTATPTATPTLVPGCAAAPDVCRTPTVGGKAAVALIDQTLDQKDQLQWKWLNGAATTASEFGNPTATTAYDLCLYDGSGLRASIAVPAGTFCAGKPCWAAKPTGFTYKDKTLAAGGLAQIALKAGIAGKAKIQVKGKGVNLPMPALATLTSPLTVELKAAAAATCWSARYAFPPAVKNDGVQFKDKAD